MGETEPILEKPISRRLGGLLCVACSVLLQTLSTIFSKQAGVVSAGQGIFDLVINPWYIALLFALGLQAIVWIEALRRLPLSYAYPFMSLVLPLNLLFANVVFGETIAWNHLIGLLFIVTGVAVVLRES